MISLIDAGCPESQLPALRHEDWLRLASLRAEMQRLAREKAEMEREKAMVK